VSSGSSKDVVEKYNENLSSQKPSWLENDFTQASISDIQIEDKLSGTEIGLISLFAVVGALLLGLVCHTCRHSWTRSIIITSAFLLFAAISTITVLMIRDLRNVSPSVDVTVGVIMISVFFITWLIVMGSFYASISSKSKVSEMLSSEKFTKNEHLEIPPPPNFLPPTLRSTPIEMNRYDIRTRKYY